MGHLSKFIVTYDRVSRFHEFHGIQLTKDLTCRPTGATTDIPVK